jgi:hypothetical protein
MYDHADPAPLGLRDVIAAWLVCVAFAMAAFVHPGFIAEPASQAQAASGNAAPAGSRGELCSFRERQEAAQRG